MKEKKECEGIKEVPRLVINCDEVLINVGGMRLTLNYDDMFKLPKLTFFSTQKGEVTFLNVNKLCEILTCPICGSHPVLKNNNKRLDFECPCYKQEGKVII